MEEATIIKIQYLYIDATELLEKKNYFLASQQLEHAMDLFSKINPNDKDDSHLIAADLQTKLKALLTTINNYLYNDSIIHNVELTDEEKEELAKEVQFDNDEFELEIEHVEPPFNVWDYFKPCFLPLQRTLDAMWRSKLKRD